MSASPAYDINTCLDHAMTILEDLVAFDTESSKSNHALIDYVARFFDARAIDYVLTPNAEATKYALFATLGPRRDGGVVLSAHSDVVPVAGQEWTSDPFTLRRHEGRLYGRGSCDMKGFAALVMALFAHCASWSFATPLHFLLSYDEETTCLGPVDLIKRFGVDLPQPAAVIVGEPTLMHVADTQKAVTTYVTHVRGHEAHSSQPMLGINAIQVAADLIHFLYDYQNELSSMRGDARFDPPHSTISVGCIEGGTARNILARSCQFLWEVRSLPGHDPHCVERALAAYIADVILPRFNGAVGELVISTQREVDVPALAPQPGTLAEHLALNYARANHTIAVSYATEAGRFQAAGLPTIICGPGSIAQAHQPDEYIEIAELEAGMRFLHRLARDMAGRNI